MNLHYYKRAAALLMVTVIGFAALTGCGKKNLDGKQTAMTINGENVSAGTLSFESHYEAAMIYTYYGSYFGEQGYFDSDAGNEDGTTIGQDMVNRSAEAVRDDVLIRQHAEEFGVSLTEEQTAKIDEVAQSFMDNNDAEVLAKLGISKEDVVYSLTLDTVWAEMLDPMAEGIDTEVTDEEAQQTSVTYVGMVAADEEEDGKSVEELNEETKAILQEILDKIKEEDDIASADIDAIAQSVDESYRGTQVYFSTNDEDPYTVDKVVADAVKGLKDGEVYDGVLVNADESRYFIVRLDKTFDPTATEERKGTIITDRKQARHDELLEQWKEEADVVMNEDVIKQVVLTDAEPYVFKEESSSAG